MDIYSFDFTEEYLLSLDGIGIPEIQKKIDMLKEKNATEKIEIRIPRPIYYWFLECFCEGNEKAFDIELARLLAAEKEKTHPGGCVFVILLWVSFLRSAHPPQYPCRD